MMLLFIFQVFHTNRKNISTISFKHFKRLLNYEKQKCVISTQKINLNNIMPVVSSFNDLSSVNNVASELPTSPLNILTLAESSNRLGKPVDYNDFISSVHTSSSTQISKSVINPVPSRLENDEVKNLSLSDKLRSLIVKYKVSHNFCNSLLEILKSEGLDVPKDVRTLLKTPKNHEIVDISGGSYIHFGLRNMLVPFLIKHNAHVYIKSCVLKIGINIDGLPIARSSKSQLWPILISIINFKELPNNVIPIGMFHGFQKPLSIEEFLNPFIIDVLDVLDNGLNVNDTLFKLEISNITCDAPAKAFLLNVKGHNAYFGCTSCIEEGMFIEHRMTYPGINAPLRTNENFRKKTDEDYHKGDSPLIRLPINITEIVVLDYMHNICLGVVKKLIEFWVKGNKEVRLEKTKLQKINNELKNLKSYVPAELCRLPRALDDIEYYKATELRTFLLYSGQIVLKSNIKKKFYSHFLLLVYAIRILICDETCCKYNELASQFLKQFVNDYSTLYGSHYISYNVHSLIHLPMFVLHHGPLDNFSCFKYENYLHDIKKSIKSIKYPLQEIYNRIIEKYKMLNEFPFQLSRQHPTLLNEIVHKTPQYFKSNDSLFAKIILPFSNILINSIKEKDRHLILTDGSLVSVQYIVQAQNKSVDIIVKRFLNCSELNANPLSSMQVGVYIVNTEQMSELYCINLSNIKYKCFFIRSSRNTAFIMSLCHAS